MEKYLYDAVGSSAGPATRQRLGSAHGLDALDGLSPLQQTFNCQSLVEAALPSLANKNSAYLCWCQLGALCKLGLPALSGVDPCHNPSSASDVAAVGPQDH